MTRLTLRHKSPQISQAPDLRPFGQRDGNYILKLNKNLEVRAALNGDVAPGLCFPQECISAFFSLRLRLILVEPVPLRCRVGHDPARFHEQHEQHELHSDLVDEFRVAFDLVDGHWD